MMGAGFLGYLRGDGAADGVLPERPAWALGLLAACLAFLAVFSVAVCLAGGRLEADWSGPKAETATLQVFAPEDTIEEQARAALNVLRTSPGVQSVRMMDLAEQETLLEPWLGPDIPIESLPLPLMIDIGIDRTAFDPTALTMRLQEEAPGAVLDDHGAWRAPLAATAGRLQLFALACLALLALAFAAAVTLAADATVAAAERAVATLRLVGANEGFIARAATRRPVLVATFGALAGSIVSMVVVAMLPRGSEQGFFLIGIGLAGRQWLLALLVPVAAAGLAWASATFAARRGLGRME